MGECLPGMASTSKSLTEAISEIICHHFAHCFHLGNCDFFVFCKLGTLFSFVFIRGYGRLDFWSLSYEGRVPESICQLSLN